MSTRYGQSTTPPRACYLYVKGRFLGPATSALGTLLPVSAGSTFRLHRNSF